MSKHRHSKDRMFITNSEHKYDWGGKKDPLKIPLSRLPFDCCALSLEPFNNPVCTIDGHVFDIINIIPFIKKYKKNPISGLPLKITDLIKLNFIKNEKGQYHDPISFKVFTDYSKIVAIRTSGNVYTADTIDELNRKSQHWLDLLTGEPFNYKDIITIQDPKNIQQRTVRDFDYLRNNLKFESANKDDSNDLSTFMDISDIGKTILEQAKQRTIQRNIDQQEKQKEAEIGNEQIKKKIKQQIESDKGLPVQEWLEYASKSGLFISERYSTSSDAISVTCTQSTVENSSGNLRFRNMTPEEIRKILYDEVRKQKEKGYVQIVLNQGSINIEVHCDLVPLTSENFLELCEKGYYDKTKFYRLIENVLIEGGDPTGTGYGGESIFGKPFRNEINNKISHNKAGIVSMANLGPTHNTSQFFITLSEQKEKDGKYSAFGEVVGGYQVLYKINKISTNMWERPDVLYNYSQFLQLKYTKNKNSLAQEYWRQRDCCKKLIKQKEQEQSQEYKLQQKALNDERWIDDKSKFELPTMKEDKKQPNQRCLGLAQNLINSDQSKIKQTQSQNFNFENWK